MLARYEITRTIPTEHRITVSDEITEQWPSDAAEALIAHELGHAVLHRKQIVLDAVASLLLFSSPAALGSLRDLQAREHQADDFASNYCVHRFGSVAPLRSALRLSNTFSQRNGPSGLGPGYLFSETGSSGAWVHAKWTWWWSLLSRLYGTNVLVYVHLPLAERLAKLESPTQEA